MGFVGMGVMPLAPVLGGWLLTTVGGTGAIAGLVAGAALGALVPTLSRSIRSVPRPAEWPRLEQGVAAGSRHEAPALG